MTPSPYHNGKPCDLREFYANVKCMFITKMLSNLTLILFLIKHTECSLSGSSIHEIFQARILAWIAISFSR